MSIKVTSYRIGAVVPTTQYGNLQPEIILEGGTLAAMKKEGMKHIQEIWDQYGTNPLKQNKEKPEMEGIKFEEVLSFTGEKILWSDYLHEYRSLDNIKLTSGSTYSSLTEKPFDSALLSEKSGNSWEVDKDELAALWKINANISTDYGTTIHRALEAYMLYHKMGEIVRQKKGLDYNYALPKNEYLRDIVLSFVNQFGTFTNAEVFVSDVKNRMAGQIDALNILDMKEKVCSIGDYKTNFELKKPKLKGYQKQMNFYRTALENKGWKVQSMDLFHFDGTKWNKFEMEREEIDMNLF